MAFANLRSNMKIFGREPVAMVAVIGAVIAFAVTFGFSGLTADHATNIMAVVTGVGALLASWATVNTRLSLLVGLGRVVLILAVGYGLSLSQEQIGLAVILIEGVAGFWLRDHNTPTETVITNN